MSIHAYYHECMDMNGNISDVKENILVRIRKGKYDIRKYTRLIENILTNTEKLSINIQNQANKFVYTRINVYIRVRARTFTYAQKNMCVGANIRQYT